MNEYETLDAENTDLKDEVAELKDEVAELKAQLAEWAESFELIEQNLAKIESVRQLRYDEKMMIQLAREALESLEGKDLDQAILKLKQLLGGEDERN